METRWICASVASLLTLATAQAQLIMTLGVNKSYYQRDAFKLEFNQGDLQLRLQDGLVILNPDCFVDPQLFFFGPSIVCPPGATGYIASGDVDRDGIRDDNQYWSVQSVIPAQIIEPARPELAQLFAAPPSKLPRPLPTFLDDSLVTFYDISTAAVRQYDVSRYALTLRYGSVPQVETANTLGAIETAGNLNVVVTGQDIVGSPLVVPVAVAVGDTGLVVADNIRVALAATPAVSDFYAISGTGTNIILTELAPNGNDPSLNVAVFAGTASGIGLPIPFSLNTVVGSFTLPAAAAKQMREELVIGTYTFTFPRLNIPDTGTPVAIPASITPIVEALDRSSRSRSGFRFTTGTWDEDVYQLDPRLINLIQWTGNDRSNVRVGDQIFFSILNDAEDTIIFPPTVPENPVLLTDPTVQEYTLPPFFFEVGDEGMMNLDYRRFLPSNGVAFDVSQRDFRAKVRMVDSYNGYAQTTMPLGTPSADFAPTGNVDRDSMTNIYEFAYQFPTNEDINAHASEQFVPQPVPPVPGFPPLVEEFSRVVTKVSNPILNANAQPAGPTAPFLDAENHIVVEVPVRPRVGTSLRYDFGLVPPGKTKPKRLKIGSQWEITTREVPVVTAAIIEVRIVVAGSGEIVGFRQRNQPNVVNLVQEFQVLRSTFPVDPALPLPDIQVSVTSIPLK